jgi:hypothetical protein
MLRGKLKLVVDVHGLTKPNLTFFQSELIWWWHLCKEAGLTGALLILPHHRVDVAPAEAHGL